MNSNFIINGCPIGATWMAWKTSYTDLIFTQIQFFFCQVFNDMFKHFRTWSRSVTRIFFVNIVNNGQKVTPWSPSQINRTGAAMLEHLDWRYHSTTLNSIEKSLTKHTGNGPEKKEASQFWSKLVIWHKIGKLFVMIRLPARLVINWLWRRAFSNTNGWRGAAVAVLLQRRDRETCCCALVVGESRDAAEVSLPACLSWKLSLNILTTFSKYSKDFCYIPISDHTQTLSSCSLDSQQTFVRFSVDII